MARWALISGRKGADKGSQVLALCRALRRAGVEVGGFYQVSLTDDEGAKRHELVRLGTGERVVVAAEVASPTADDEVTFCNLAFRPDAFEHARQWLIEDLRRASVVFVGDLSKLEVSGRGHDGSVRAALRAPDRTIAVLNARADQLFWAVERYELEDDVIAALELPQPTISRVRFRAQVVAAARGATRMT